MNEDGSHRLPIADRVYDTLSVQLMTGERPPGERLKIHMLSREFDVSPTPIREALARLEHTGFIERHSQRGYVVARLLGAEEIAQLMDARLLLEPTMARAAAERASAGFLSRLADTITVMQDTKAGPYGETLRECWLADEQFHGLIADQSGNPFIAKAYRSLGGQLQRFRIIGKSGVSHARSACGEHEMIFAAIESGDIDGTATAMSRHIVNAKGRAFDDVVRAARAPGADN
ncbi:FCD domain-containing protein [Leifsonia bigeumensis]|uniref:FCD domain-containing protein n=1 Tax=Leifsonella bigeumensis TaxID=433643 RepID=A0ABP7FHZ4_9MICO